MGTRDFSGEDVYKVLVNIGGEPADVSYTAMPTTSTPSYQQ